MSHINAITQVDSTGVDATDTANHAVRVNVVAGGGSGGTSSTFGAAFPGTGTAAGAKDNLGNMAALNVDASGNLKVITAGGGSAVTIVDGGDVAEGATTDAAVTTDVNATVSAKLRGLVKILGDVWDSGNHWLKVSIQNATLAVTQSGAPWTQRIQDGVGATLATVTAGNALKVDGSAVTQPVSGTVTANQGGAPWSDNITQVGGSAITLGQKTMANSVPVVLASDESTVTISGTVTANQGGAPWAENVTQFGGTNISTGTGASGAGIPRVTISNDSSLAANQSVNVNQVGGAALTEGQKVMASSVPVVIASDQSAIPVTGNFSPAAPTTGAVTVTSVGGVAVQIAASNSSRKQFYIYNNLGKTLTVAFFTSPAMSVTLFSIQIAANSYYESPIGCYQGVISALRGSGTGDVLVTELT